MLEALLGQLTSKADEAHVAVERVKNRNLLTLLFRSFSLFMEIVPTKSSSCKISTSNQMITEALYTLPLLLCWFKCIPARFSRCDVSRSKNIFKTRVRDSDIYDIISLTTQQASALLSPWKKASRSIWWWIRNDNLLFIPANAQSFFLFLCSARQSSEKHCAFYMWMMFRLFRDGRLCTKQHTRGIHSMMLFSRNCCLFFDSRGVAESIFPGCFSSSWCYQLFSHRLSLLLLCNGEVIQVPELEYPSPIYHTLLLFTFFSELSQSHFCSDNGFMARALPTKLRTLHSFNFQCCFLPLLSQSDVNIIRNATLSNNAHLVVLCKESR